jgi:hypothetical protein
MRQQVKVSNVIYFKLKLPIAKIDVKHKPSGLNSVTFYHILEDNRKSINEKTVPVCLTVKEKTTLLLLLTFSLIKKYIKWCSVLQDKSGLQWWMKVLKIKLTQFTIQTEYQILHCHINTARKIGYFKHHLNKHKKQRLVHADRTMTLCIFLNLSWIDE